MASALKSPSCEQRGSDGADCQSHPLVVNSAPYSTASTAIISAFAMVSHRRCPPPHRRDALLQNVCRDRRTACVGHPRRADAGEQQLGRGAADSIARYLSARSHVEAFSSARLVVTWTSLCRDLCTGQRSAISSRRRRWSELRSPLISMVRSIRSM